MRGFLSAQHSCIEFADILFSLAKSNLMKIALFWEFARQKKLQVFMQIYYLYNCLYHMVAVMSKISEILTYPERDITSKKGARETNS